MIERAWMRHLNPGSHHDMLADASTPIYRDLNFIGGETPLPINKARVMAANFQSSHIRLQDLEAYLSGPYLS